MNSGLRSEAILADRRMIVVESEAGSGWESIVGVVSI